LVPVQRLGQRGQLISPWLLFVPVSGAVLIAIAILLSRHLPRCAAALRVTGPDDLYLFRLSVLLIFGWYGAAAIYDYGADDIRAISSLVAFRGVLGCEMPDRRVAGCNAP
jgi:hypothetical protein